MKTRTTLYTIFMAALIAVYGCSSPPPPPPQPVAAPPSRPMSTKESQEILKGTKFDDGYVYEQRNRRDPFMALVVTVKKRQTAEESKIGTLEGYDLSEFVLSAIARRGSQYFALLTTPDQRAFTVTEGNIIGFNKGRVEEITQDKIVFVEFSRDYKGDLKPKRMTLEFVKGESD